MDASRLMRQMTDKMTHVTQTMSRQMRQMQPEERRYPLTQQQQITRFLNHTPSSLEYIRSTHGDVGFAQYVSSMARLWARMQNART